MLNVTPYIHTVIDWDSMARDWGNSFTFVSQSPYRGKPEAGLAAGATVTLQINNDTHDHSVDKSGRKRDDNALETFMATVVGCNYPLPFVKGDKVTLDGFLPDASYYINYSLILRFSSIEKAQQPAPGAGPKG